MVSAVARELRDLLDSFFNSSRSRVCTRKDFSGPPLRLGPLISTGVSSSAFVGGRSLLSGLQAGVHGIPQRGHILVGAKGSSYFLIRYDGMIRRPQSDEEPRVANALP